MLLSAEQLFKYADFIFQHDLAPAHTDKSTKSWINGNGAGVLDWPANSPDLNPIENRCFYEFHNFSWIIEINELSHDILIYWDAPVCSLRHN